jgi:hypothetical protein
VCATEDEEDFLRRFVFALYGTELLIDGRKRCFDIACSATVKKIVSSRRNDE